VVCMAFVLSEGEDIICTSIFFTLYYHGQGHVIFTRLEADFVVELDDESNVKTVSY
jgi:hypothetical protein